jgi:hypothetical protein
MLGCSACDEGKLDTEADKDPNHEYRDEKLESPKTPQ